MTKSHARWFAVAALVLPMIEIVRAESPSTQPTSPLGLTVKDIHGQPVPLSKYQGKVMMIVNVASKCGNTPQYAALEKLNEKYADQGLAILGFPCNDFGGQEPGSEAQILTFCTSTYDVKFDMFSKVVVKGKDKTPLFDYLISKTTDPKFGGDIKWNFNKFIIGRDGQVAARFEPKKLPDSEDVIKTIEAELAKK